jgi:hypothetical protein
MGGFSSIGDLSGGDYLQSALDTALHAANSSLKQSTPVESDGNEVSKAELSPLAQVTSTLGQLQQSNPDKFREVARQLAANLDTDAQTAQSEGETAVASQLSQLASAFITAAQNGELPDLQDLIALGEL